MGQNYDRIAVVWMEEYAKYYHIREPRITKHPLGDISYLLKLRKDLKCKPFKWFTIPLLPLSVLARQPFVSN